jgi:hypothetical protein
MGGAHREAPGPVTPTEGKHNARTQGAKDN